MDQGSLISHFETLLPLASEWAEGEEARALAEGVPLSEPESAVAAELGVREPRRVRLLRVERVPVPAHPQLRAACEAIDFLSPATRGLALRYGIFVRTDCWRERPLIAHELVHTAQYERFGGIDSFLREYLMECLTVGYPQSPLEQEAISRSAGFL